MNEIARTYICTYVLNRYTINNSIPLLTFVSRVWYFIAFIREEIVAENRTGNCILVLDVFVLVSECTVDFILN